MLITEGALIARIKRKLAHSGDRFCLSRGRMRACYGRWHIVDRTNTVTASGDDLEDLGRQLGVLARKERLAA
jgi:hypothetical protein